MRCDVSGRRFTRMRSFRRSAAINVPLQHQSHHLVPVGIFSKPGFADHFRTLRRDGFDVCNFLHNGIFLPSTEAAAMRCGLPLHRGPHHRYNDLVGHRIAAIMREMDAGGRRFSARCDAAERLKILTSALRNTLHRRHPLISLNQRDPFASRVDFTELDGACDLLWLATK